MVPGLPGTVVGQAQQPGVELIAQGWPQALLVSLEHLQRERGRPETQTTSVVRLGQDLGGQGLFPSSTHPTHPAGDDLGAQHHPQPSFPPCSLLVMSFRTIKNHLRPSRATLDHPGLPRTTWGCLEPPMTMLDHLEQSRTI